MYYNKIGMTKEFERGVYMDKILKFLVICFEVSFAFMLPALFYETVKADGINSFIFFLMISLLSVWFITCIKIFAHYNGIFFNRNNSKLNDF